MKEKITSFKSKIAYYKDQYAKSMKFIRENPEEKKKWRKIKIIYACILFVFLVYSYLFLNKML